MEKRFEYRAVSVKELNQEYTGAFDIKKLNEYGRDGWELIMVDRGQFIFKRELV